MSASFVLAKDSNLTQQQDIFQKIDINYSLLKKSSIGDILNKSLPITEASEILTSRSQTYNMVKNKLEVANIPQELVFVAFTESKLKPIKTGGYAGIWQLNTSEARRAGLKVGARKIDERYNADRATDAFIVNISRLYAKFGRWDLAILAYNCGEGRLQFAINKAGDDDIDKLFAPNKKYLPFASKKTMSQILSFYAAVHQIEHDNIFEQEIKNIDSNETNNN